MQPKRAYARVPPVAALGAVARLLPEEVKLLLSFTDASAKISRLSMLHTVMFERQHRSAVARIKNGYLVGQMGIYCNT